MRIDGPIYSVTHGTGFWDDITAWMSTDFYRFNPADDSATMNYSTYHAGRVAGTIPAPDPAIVHHNLMHPMMQADFSLDRRDDDAPVSERSPIIRDWHSDPNHNTLP